MSRQRARDCLDGKKTFTKAEMKAISANVSMRILNSYPINYQELEDVNRAWKGAFDEVFKQKEV
jgi:hypothetical protein